MPAMPAGPAARSVRSVRSAMAAAAAASSERRSRIATACAGPVGPAGAAFGAVPVPGHQSWAAADAADADAVSGETDQDETGKVGTRMLGEVHLWIPSAGVAATERNQPWAAMDHLAHLAELEWPGSAAMGRCLALVVSSQPSRMLHPSRLAGLGARS